MQLLTIGKNQAGQRLDKFLKKALPNAGTGFLYKMLRKKNITLNGKKAEGKEILAPGDEVKCFFSEETYASLSGAGAAEDTSDYRKAYRSLKDISVLYEDENILLLNKPAGVLTQKAKPEDLSLNEWLIGHLLAADVIKETILPLSIHRSATASTAIPAVSYCAERRWPVPRHSAGSSRIVP